LLSVKESSLGLMFCTCHCLALSFKDLNAARNGNMKAIHGYQRGS
jgi:hypothetical protein